MSNILNVVAQNSLGDVTFVALQGAAGDRTPARWTVPAAVPNICLVTAQMSAEFNKARTARHVNVDMVVPYVVTDTNTGLSRPVSRAEYHGRFILPTNVPQSVINNLVLMATTFSGYTNASNAAVRDQIMTGYSFT